MFIAVVVVEMVVDMDRYSMSKMVVIVVLRIDELAIVKEQYLKCFKKICAYDGLHVVDGDIGLIVMTLVILCILV